MRVLRLVGIERSRDCILARCSVDDSSFSTSVWYEDVDLDSLARQHGEAFDRIAFHVAMFQLNAVASLRPDAIALGDYARFATPAFMSLWSTLFDKVWAQWRWENDLPDYAPRFLDAATASAFPPIQAFTGPVEQLLFCGGGKDSLVAARLLERAGLPFATLGYSHSIYGAAAAQHALLDRVADRTARARAERQWVIDDFLDAPVLRLRPELGLRTLTAAETPASIFAALPLVLARGYRHLVLGHEASANAPNLTSARGEAINHQWGKSWEAERLLEAYVREQLVDVRYFSVLQPVHDELILELLARDAALAPLTHSCNVQKPWCGACAKCVYVWLQMAAHLPDPIVRQTFGRHLDEDARNERWLRQLLGLTEHSPFECVGSPPEARLALALSSRRSPLLDALRAGLGPLDAESLAAPFLAVGERHGMPEPIAARVMPILREAAAAAAARISRSRAATAG